MSKKIILTAITICLAIGIAFLLRPQNSIEGTWIGEKGTLAIGNTYEWTHGTDSIKGKCKVLKGKEAKKAIEEYADNYAKYLDGVPENEIRGAQDTIKALSAHVDEGAVVLVEDLKSAIIDGVDVEPISGLYIVETEDDHLHLTGAVGGSESFEKYEEDKELEKAPLIQSNEQKQTFSYKLPEDYVVSFGLDRVVHALTEDGRELTISVEDGFPVEGFLDEYPIRDEYRKGYLCKRYFGPNVTYAYLYNENGKFCRIECSNAEDLLKCAETVAF